MHLVIQFELLKPSLRNLMTCREIGGGPAVISALTGERLSLREGGKALQGAFEREVGSSVHAAPRQGSDLNSMVTLTLGLGLRLNAANFALVPPRMQAIQSAPQVLHPHVSTLLEGPEWGYWRRKLDGLSYREDAMQQARSGFQSAEFFHEGPSRTPLTPPRCACCCLDDWRRRGALRSDGLSGGGDLWC